MPSPVSSRAVSPISPGSTETHYTPNRSSCERLRSVDGAGTRAEENRAGRAETLLRIGYEELLEGRLAYGTPDMVAAKLLQLRERLGLSGIMIEPNVGGHNTPERVKNSIKLFAQETVPQLR